MLKHLSFRTTVTLGAIMLVLIGGLRSDELQAQETQPQSADSPSAPKVHVVKKDEFILHMEREGRIDSAHRHKLRLVPKAFSGPFEVVEVLKRTGRVKKGDVILRLDSEAIEKELDAARMNLDHARKRLAIAREEDRLLKEADAVRLEQTEKTKVKAATELTIWEKFDGPDMLKSAELALRQREYYLADEKEELQQLEQMYQGTHLAGETKDIVLERARRGVKMSAEWLVLAQHDDAITRQTRHPQQDQQVRDAARWSAQDDAHARLNAGAGQQRKAMDIEQAERGLRDAQDRFAKLELDMKLLEVSAPVDGVMTRIELEPKDQVSSRQTICEILDPSQFIMKFSATAEDLRVLNGLTSGEPIEVSLPEYPELEISGLVQEMAEIGAAADQATHFPVTVAITTDNPLVRIGLRCQVHSSRTMQDALTIPIAAVRWEYGRAYCDVQNGQVEEKRELTVGPKNQKMLVVLSGLSAGDQVIVDQAVLK